METTTESPGWGTRIAGRLKSAPTELLDKWFEPIAPERMRFFERFFAFALIFYVADWGQDLYEWLTPRGYHIAEADTNPVYPRPLPLLPSELALPFLIYLFATASCVLLGLWRRWVLPLCFLNVVYIQSADLIAAFTLNKLFIVGFFVLMMQPLPTNVSAGGGGETKVRVSAWAVRLIQMTLLVQYFTAGTCKIFHGDWMQVPHVLHTHAVGLYRTEAAAWAIEHIPIGGWVIFGYGGLFFEVFAPITLGIRKLRPIGFAWGWGFQFFVALFMIDLIYFSTQMASFYILFLPTRWVVRWERAAEDKLAVLGGPFRSAVGARD